MPNRTVTIQQAIDRGNELMSYQLWVLIAVSPIVAIILASAGLFVSAALAIPVSVALSIAYAAWMRPRWRIWAYSHVTDIHQFQRSGELAGLLVLHSHNKAGGLIGVRKRKVLKSLLSRFDEEPVFVDDPAFPATTKVFVKSIFDESSHPAFVFSKEGITCAGDFIPWGEIKDERVAKVSSSRYNADTGATTASANVPFLRMDTKRYGQVEHRISKLSIKPWKLDLLLYIYRGRYEAKRKLS